MDTKNALTFALNLMISLGDKVAMLGAARYILGSVTFTVLSVIATHKAHRAFQRAALRSGNAVYDLTEFVLLGPKKANASEETYQLRLTTIEGSVSLPAIFGTDAVGKQLIKLLNKAKKHCTADEPLVFSHFPKLLSDKERETAVYALTSAWVRYFSNDLNRKAAPQSIPLSPGQSLEMSDKLPVLVYEPGARRKQLRILLLSPQQTSPEHIPDPERIKVDVPHQIDRVHTLKAVARQLQDPDQEWIRTHTTVRFATGKISTPRP